MAPKANPTRRQLLAAALLLTTYELHAKPATVAMEVWKSPTCGCCKDWIAHMEANGFSAIVRDVSEAQKSTQRAKLGMPQKLGSCHTVLVGGYVVEGHVPAREVRRLLNERPRALGLAVPGMPIGSPGMDGPAYGGQKMPYAVLLVQRDASTSVFHAYA